MKVLFVFGTRPEGIKLAPLIKTLEKDSRFEVEVCLTGQHKEMLEPVLKLFSIRTDYDLDVMRSGQDLTHVTAAILSGLRAVMLESRPDVVLVHGDTATTFAASLAAFYAKRPVAHVEAGLRTGDLSSPWPEEANRKLTAVLAHMHFVPTEGCMQNLINEGVAADQIFITGNTVIDALLSTVRRLGEASGFREEAARALSFLRPGRRMILVTGHRRESFGEGFERICESLRAIASRYPDVEIVYPVHLNPMVRAPVERMLKGVPNIHLIAPLEYLQFVSAMQRSYLILTDSGGIQEEAPSLGKPVLVMRETTERPEAIEAGTVRLVGTDPARIIAEVSRLLDDESAYEAMSYSHNPYGDGTACGRIAEVLMQFRRSAKSAVPVGVS